MISRKIKELAEIFACLEPYLEPYFEPRIGTRFTGISAQYRQKKPAAQRSRHAAGLAFRLSARQAFALSPESNGST